MSYLLEALGRGLLAELRTAFEPELPTVEQDDVETLRARWTLSPKSVDLALRLGTAALQAGRLRQAQEAFDAARQIEPASSKPLIGLACVHDAQGQPENALRYLQAASGRDPGDAAITFAAALVNERLERCDEAAAYYGKSIELCPHLRNAYERLAAIAIREGNWQAAIEPYERLAELEPGNLDALLTLGNLYLQAQRPEDAIKRYQQALFVEPECDDVPDDAELQAERLNEAIRTLERLVRKYPGMAPFHVRLADLYVKAGKDREAVAQYKVALDTQPNFLEATVKLGTQHMRQGRFVDAALSFNQAVELNDRLLTAFVGLGCAQHACGQTLESMATFDLAASLEPSTTLLFAESARLQLQTEQRVTSGSFDDCLFDDEEDETEEEEAAFDTLLEESLRRHQQALLEHPGHADLHYRYGLLLRQVGRREEAIEAFRNAVRINPNYSKAQVKLAISLKEQGAVDDAIQAFRQALHLDQRYVDVHYQLGLLFAQRNQFDLAIEQFEQAVAGNEHNLAFRANLALALQNVGLIDRAAATWQAICELSVRNCDILSRRETILRDANGS